MYRLAHFLDGNEMGYDQSRKHPISRTSLHTRTLVFIRVLLRFAKDYHKILETQFFGQNIMHT